jgi:tetratricopeptide (TPR) repeat protein
MNWPESVKRLIKTIGKGLGDPWRGAFLWVGAGLSIPAGYPSLGKLAEMLRKESLEKLDENLDPLRTVDAFVEANGQGYLLQNLADVFDQKPPMEYHKDLMKLPWKGIITTNYDELLEDALKRIDKRYIKITLDQNLDLTARPEVPLYKVHGDIADFKEIVLDGKSYETFNRRYPLLKADLESLLRKHSIVFFGCSMTDERLLGWLRGLGRGGRRALMPSCAVITENDWDTIPKQDRKLLTQGNIKPVLLNDHAEIPDLISHLVGEILVGMPDEGLHFSISPGKPDQWRIIPNVGSERLVDVPWKEDRTFAVSLMEFTRMADKRIVAEKDRAELHSCAVSLGEALSAALLTDEDRQRIRNAIGQDEPPPLVTIESDDDLILSLPWELLRMDGEFAVRDSRIDLVRSTPPLAEHPITLSPPDRYLKLVVNVSAPEGPSIGHLDYEAESYRIIRALHDYSEVVFTELGAAEDMVNAVAEHEPIGVHFSGHGAPGKLLFEDDEGMEDFAAISDLLKRIRTKSPGRFPRFFYLASCHGNTPADPEEGESGSTISAAQLHREGVVQVIGYYGPIVDELSTMAEVAIYRELAAGRTTRHGVRQARAALSRGPDALGKGIHRGEAAKEAADAFPFTWAQLVFYHRGPDYPLSLKLPEKYAQDQEAKLQRSFEDTGTEQRRILSTGFIGRRRELHRFQRVRREGRHVFVFQGLGGLGKSTLAFRALPMLARESPTLTVWCHEIEEARDQAQELTNRLSEFGQTLFGAGWIDVVQAVDRVADATEPQRFRLFLGAILGPLDRMVIYLDNMESLLTGQDNDDPEAFGNWRSPEVAEIWQILKEMSGSLPIREPSVESALGLSRRPGLSRRSRTEISIETKPVSKPGSRIGSKLSVVASCRYRNPAFKDDIIHVPEMTDSAIFRMMGWFDGLRRLSVAGRARLVTRLHGHPRAAEFLDDLISEAIGEWEDRRGEWVTPATEDGIEKEWEELISPALPEVEERLRQDLLLDAIWERVLDERCRRMLFRMTILRRPWDWDLMMRLGEPDEDAGVTERTAQRLRGTSLLGQVEEKDAAGKWVRLFQIHPMTARFIAEQFKEDEAEGLRQETYRRVGSYLEKLVKMAETSPDIRVYLDAGHYLFQCGEFDRAYELLGSSSDFLQERGMVWAGIAVLEPFERAEVMERMQPKLCGQMLGTLGSAYDRLGQVEKAIEYCQQALDIAKEVGDRESEGALLGNLGVAYADLGQVEEAIEYYQQALVIQKDIGDRMGEGNKLGNLGSAYYHLGQVEKAIEYYQQALDISREIGDRRGEGIHLGNLGLAYAHLGQVEKAIEYYQQALVIQKDIGDRMGEGNQLGNLGSAYYHLGQVEKAIEYHQQALVISREIGDKMGEGIHLGNLGLAYYHLGQVEKAIEYYGQALAISREIGDRRGEGIHLGNLGLAYAHLGQVEKAIEYYRRGLDIAREIGDRTSQGYRLGSLGAAYADLGQVEKAKECLQAALAIAREIKDPRMEAIALRNLEKL